MSVQLEECEACGKPVSKIAIACGQCGHPAGGARTRLVVLAMVGAIIGVGAVALLFLR